MLEQVKPVGDAAVENLRECSVPGGKQGRAGLKGNYPALPERHHSS